MRLVTANIGRGIGPKQVEADMNKIKSAFPRAVVGWQEIDEADEANEHAILRAVFGKYHIINFNSRVPVTVPDGAKVIKQESFRLSPGVERTSPPRVATEVWIQTKYGVVVIINFHLIAGAWNNKIEPNQEVRRKLWWESVERLQARIAWHHKHGRTVFWMGDTNRMDMVKLHKDEKRLVTAGIDSISVVEGEVKAKKIATGSVDLNSDHSAKWAQVELSS